MYRLRLATLVLADLGVLVALRPHLTLIAHLRHPGAWVAQGGTDRAAATLGGAGIWLAAVWLALGLAVAAVGALPGTAGRLAHRLARVLLPRTLYRLVAGAAGLGVLLTPVLASAAPSRGPAATAATPGPTPSRPTPTPRWPSDAPVPAPQWPTSPAARHAAAPRREGPARARPGQHRQRPETVVVRHGDTLWSIAADHLPAHPSPRRIAASWPRWYAANRGVIGDDPGLIVPGQHLHPPAKGSPP